MKKLLIILTLALMATASNGESTTTGLDHKENNFNAEELKKMKVQDFDAQLTIEIMDGHLKGTHIFKKNPELKNQVINIRAKKDEKNTDETKKLGSFYAGSIDAGNPDFLLISLSKNFTGMIQEGSHPARKSSAPLVIKNNNESAPWSRVYGKAKTNSDIIFTHVGEWLPIRGKKSVRRVEGSFTDQVEFEYSSTDKSYTTETATVKVNFSVVEVLRPKLY